MILIHLKEASCTIPKKSYVKFLRYLKFLPKALYSIWIANLRHPFMDNKSIIGERFAKLEDFCNRRAPLFIVFLVGWHFHLVNVNNNENYVWWYGIPAIVAASCETVWLLEVASWINRHIKKKGLNFGESVWGLVWFLWFSDIWLIITIDSQVAVQFERW